LLSATSTIQALWSIAKIFIHKPHPTLKIYAVKQILETLKLHGRL
jgi:hypothetical protein